MKRIPELRELSDDHHTGLVIARRCKQAGHSSAAAASIERVWEHVLEAFDQHLEPHFRIEEQHLLPALDAIGEEGLARKVREEHRALRGLLRSVPVSRDLVGRFGGLLESHIRYEERQVFTPTQDRLPAAALDAIESACRALPRVRSFSFDG